MNCFGAGSTTGPADLIQKASAMLMYSALAIAILPRLISANVLILTE